LNSLYITLRITGWTLRDCTGDELLVLSIIVCEIFVIFFHRVSGTHSIVNKLMAELNKGNYHHDFGSEQWGDVHNFTSLLKAFFNDLPDPIIPSNMYSQFVAAAKEHDFNRLYTMKGLVSTFESGNACISKLL